MNIVKESSSLKCHGENFESTLPDGEILWPADDRETAVYVCWEGDLYYARIEVGQNRHKKVPAEDLPKIFEMLQRKLFVRSNIYSR